MNWNDRSKRENQRIADAELRKFANDRVAADWNAARRSYGDAAATATAAMYVAIEPTWRDSLPFAAAFATGLLVGWALTL